MISTGLMLLSSLVSTPISCGGGSDQSTELATGMTDEKVTASTKSFVAGERANDDAPVVISVFVRRGRVWDSHMIGEANHLDARLVTRKGEQLYLGTRDDHGVPGQGIEGLLLSAVGEERACFRIPSTKAVSYVGRRQADLSEGMKVDKAGYQGAFLTIDAHAFFKVRGRKERIKLKFVSTDGGRNWIAAAPTAAKR